MRLFCDYAATPPVVVAFYDDAATVPTGAHPSTTEVAFSGNVSSLARVGTLSDGWPAGMPDTRPYAAPVPGTRTAHGDDLLRALTSDQVAALSAAKPLDQRLLSAQRRAFPETSPKIARLATVVGTTPAAWFDAVGAMLAAA